MSFRVSFTTTLENLIFEAKSVSLVDDNGYLQILAGHQDLYLNLNVSILKIELEDGKTESYFVNGGLVRMEKGELNIATPASLKIEPKVDLDNYLSIIKSKTQTISDTIKNAILKGGRFEAIEKEDLYLFAEERLSKFELFRELLKGK